MPHERIAAAHLAGLARRFPAVAILGPRQIGKSTLARLAFPDWERLDLERADDFARLARDPAFVLAQEERWVIDEAQRLPELFTGLRPHLDASARRRVVLLGSAAPGLVRGLSESLTGRIAPFELGGVSCLEEDPERSWVLGGFPRLHWDRPRARPDEWYPAYLSTTLERDVAQLGFRLSAARMRTLLAMVASMQGGLVNLSDLGGSLGTSYHTVGHMLDVLEGVFLIRRLRPWFANVKKRLVKSPKIYVRDTGMLHALLGIGFTKKALLSHAKAGASFETFIIEQIVQHATLADPGAEPFFYRPHGGVEVDLLLRLRGTLVPIEIKLGTSSTEIEALRRCMADLGLRRGYLVTSGSGTTPLAPDIARCGLGDLLEALDLVPARRTAAVRRGLRR